MKALTVREQRAAQRGCDCWRCNVLAKQPDWRFFLSMQCTESRKRSPIRCPTGVLNGFPIKNSMMMSSARPQRSTDVPGPSRMRQQADPLSLRDCCGSHNKVGHQLNCVMRFKGKAARNYQMVRGAALVQRTCATLRRSSLLHPLLRP